MGHSMRKHSQTEDKTMKYVLAILATIIATTSIADEELQIATAQLAIENSIRLNNASNVIGSVQEEGQIAAAIALEARDNAEAAESKVLASLDQFYSAKATGAAEANAVNSINGFGGGIGLGFAGNQQALSLAFKGDGFGDGHSSFTITASTDGNITAGAGWGFSF